MSYRTQLAHERVAAIGGGREQFERKLQEDKSPATGIDECVLRRHWTQITIRCPRANDAPTICINDK